jgi:hypothetical protein
MYIHIYTCINTHTHTRTHAHTHAPHATPLSSHAWRPFPASSLPFSASSGPFPQAAHSCAHTDVSARRAVPSAPAAADTEPLASDFLSRAPRAYLVIALFINGNCSHCHDGHEHGNQEQVRNAHPGRVSRVKSQCGPAACQQQRRKKPASCDARACVPCRCVFLSRPRLRDF